MNEFDRLLETQLRRFLDPIVKATAPVRRLRAEPRLELTLAPEQLVAVPIPVKAFS
jgi:hypothetical protein